MNNYDDYKTESPYEDEDLVNECAMCGTPTDKEYCSSKCRKADDI